MYIILLHNQFYENCEIYPQQMLSTDLSLKSGAFPQYKVNVCVKDHFSPSSHRVAYCIEKALWSFSGVGVGVVGVYLKNQMPFVCNSLESMCFTAIRICENSG